MSVDPLAQEFAAWSGCNYILGNQVGIVGPDGRNPILGSAPLGAGIGAIVGAVASIGVQLYYDGNVSWPEVGRPTTAGAVTGFFVGSGSGIVPMMRGFTEARAGGIEAIRAAQKAKRGELKASGATKKQIAAARSTAKAEARQKIATQNASRTETATQSILTTTATSIKNGGMDFGKIRVQNNRKAIPFYAVIFASIFLIISNWESMHFFFYNSKAKGEISVLDDNIFRIKYYHPIIKEEIELKGRARPKEILDQFKDGDTVIVEYSTKYPAQVGVNKLVPPSWGYGIFISAIGFLGIIVSVIKILIPNSNCPND